MALTRRLITALPDRLSAPLFPERLAGNSKIVSHTWNARRRTILPLNSALPMDKMTVGTHVQDGGQRQKNVMSAGDIWHVLPGNRKPRFSLAKTFLDYCDSSAFFNAIAL
jgi:hypothetical protein